MTRSTALTPAPPVGRTDVLPREAPASPIALVTQRITSAGAIRTIEGLQQLLEAIRPHAHVVGPTLQVSALAQGYELSLSIVSIDAAVSARTGNGPDCYRASFMSKGPRRPDDDVEPAQVGLNKNGLNKIATAVGVSWLDFPNSRRVDDGAERNLWSFHVAGEYTQPDGSKAKLAADATVDLREGSAQIQEVKTQWDDKLKRKVTLGIGQWSDQRLIGARAKGPERCETIAKNRAIRSLGVAQVYTVDELRKPFVCIRFAFKPDMDDPQVKLLVTAHHLGAAHLLYGAGNVAGVLGAGVQPAPALLTERPGDDASDKAPSGRPAALGPAAPARPPIPVFEDEAPAEQDPPAPAGERVIQGGANKPPAGGFRLQLERTGLVYTTDEEICRAALLAREKGVLVAVDTETRDGLKWVVDMTISGEAAE